jgi:hypothetical protein
MTPVICGGAGIVAGEWRFVAEYWRQVRQDAKNAKEKKKAVIAMPFEDEIAPYNVPLLKDGIRRIIVS